MTGIAGSLELTTDIACLVVGDGAGWEVWELVSHIGSSRHPAMCEPVMRFSHRS